MSQDRIGWELGGLADGQPNATTGWRHPRSVAVDRDDLVFEWWPDLLFTARSSAAGELGVRSWDRWRDQRRLLMSYGVVDVYPSRDMLLRFAGLWDASTEQIRVFAARYGALQEQVANDPAWSPPALLPNRQSIQYWRGISRSFARALDLAAPPNRTIQQEAELLLLVNGHLFQSGVVDFLTFEGGHPRVLRSSGGLYGGLAVELLSAVARVGLRLCEGCGLEVDPGGRRFCRSCRDLGVPGRRRQERYQHRRTVERGLSEPGEP